MALATSIRIEFVQEMPLSLNHYIDDQVPTLIVLDDRMFRVTSSKAVAELFTDGSSHRNLSVVVDCKRVHWAHPLSRTKLYNILVYIFASV